MQIKNKVILFQYTSTDKLAGKNLEEVSLKGYYININYRSK